MIEVGSLEHMDHAQLIDLAARAGLLLSEQMTRKQLVHHLQAAVFQELPARKPDDSSTRSG